jgi:isochorismate synthase EntC
MRVETCPISGTIRRGENALEDAEQIKLLLSSKKEESELTMVRARISSRPLLPRMYSYYGAFVYV